MFLSWSISSICFWKTNLFLVLCAIIKSVEGLVYLLEPYSHWSWLSHILIFVLNSLKWDKSLSVCVLFNSFCSLVLLCSLVELWNQLCVDLILRYNLDNILLSYTFCVLLALLGVLVQTISSFCSWKYCARIFTQIYPMACFTFFDHIYRINSIKS